MFPEILDFILLAFRFEVKRCTEIWLFPVLDKKVLHWCKMVVYTFSSNLWYTALSTAVEADKLKKAVFHYLPSMLKVIETPCTLYPPLEEPLYASSSNMQATPSPFGILDLINTFLKLLNLIPCLYHTSFTSSFVRGEGIVAQDIHR